MKKLIIALFTLFTITTFTTESNAQLEARAGLALGKIKTKTLGVNLTSKAKIGTQIGLTYSKTINEKFSLRPGLMYTMKGGEFVDQDTGMESGGRLGYIGMPLDIVFTTPINDYNLNLHIGPYFDFLIHGDEILTEDMSNLDYGYNYGVGLDLGKYGLGVNFSSGIKKVVDIEIPDLLVPISISQRNLFTAFYVTMEL